MGFNCVVNSLRFVYFQVNCGLNIALERLGTRIVYNYDLLIAANYLQKIAIRNVWTLAIISHHITFTNCHMHFSRPSPLGNETISTCTPAIGLPPLSYYSHQAVKMASRLVPCELENVAPQAPSHGSQLPRSTLSSV